MGHPIDRDEAYLIEPFGTIKGREFPHTGDDWARRVKGPEGTPMPGIFAAYDGEVIAAGYHAQAGYRTVIAYDDIGIFGVYGHQSQLNTYVGAHVTEGKFIGRMGATGLTSGVHLHYAEYTDRDRALSGIVAYWLKRPGLTLAQWARESGLDRPNYYRTAKQNQELDMTKEEYEALVKRLDANQADLEWIKSALGGSNEHTPAVRDDLDWIKRAIGGSNKSSPSIRSMLGALRKE